MNDLTSEELAANRIAASRMQRETRSAASAKRQDNAIRHTNYGGYQASSGGYIVQPLGGTPVAGGQSRTNGLMQFGQAVLALSRGNGSVIDAMPTPPVQKSPVVVVSPPRSTTFIAVLILGRTVAPDPLDPSPSNQECTYQVYYSDKTLNWKFTDSALRRFAPKGYGFFASQLKEPSFVETLYDEITESSVGFAAAQGDSPEIYGSTTIIKRVDGVEVINETTPRGEPAFIENSWGAGSTEASATYKVAFPPYLQGSGSYSALEVTDNRRLSYISKADSSSLYEASSRGYALFNGKLLSKKGTYTKTAESHRNDGQTTSSTSSSSETEVLGNVFVLPEGLQEFIYKEEISETESDGSGTYHDSYESENPTAHLIREDYQAAIIQRYASFSYQNFTYGTEDDSSSGDGGTTDREGFFLTFKDTQNPEKKLNNSAALFMQIQSSPVLEFPQGQTSQTLTVRVKETTGGTISQVMALLIGKQIIISVKQADESYRNGYGTLTSFSAIASSAQLKEANVTLNLTQLESLEWDSQAQRIAGLGAFYSNHGSILNTRITSLTAAQLAPYDSGSGVAPQQTSFLADGNIYFAKLPTTAHTGDIEHYAEVFTLEEDDNEIIQCVKQPQLMTGTLQPLITQTSEGEPLPLQVLDISFNPKKEEYKFKVLLQSAEAAPKVYVGGDSPPTQIGSYTTAGGYQLLASYIYNV